MEGVAAIVQKFVGSFVVSAKINEGVPIIILTVSFRITFELKLVTNSNLISSSTGVPADIENENGVETTAVSLAGMNAKFSVPLIIVTKVEREFNCTSMFAPSERPLFLNAGINSTTSPGLKYC